MRNALAFSILSLFIHFALAHDLKVDLGTYPADLCIRSAISSDSPNLKNKYLKRTVRVAGRVFFEANTDRDQALVLECARDAKGQLSDSFSPSNIQQFGELFEKYITFCTRSRGSQARIIRAFVDQKSTCEGDG